MFSEKQQTRNTRNALMRFYIPMSCVPQPPNLLNVARLFANGRKHLTSAACLTSAVTTTKPSLTHETHETVETDETVKRDETHSPGTELLPRKQTFPHGAFAKSVFPWLQMLQAPHPDAYILNGISTCP